jgi:hypothetical protein
MFEETNGNQTNYIIKNWGFIPWELIEKLWDCSVLFFIFHMSILQ